MGGVLDTLRDCREPKGKPVASQIREVLSRGEDSAGGWPEFTRQEPEERRLATGVGSQEAGEKTAIYRGGDLVQDGPSTMCKGEVVQLDFQNTRLAA